MMVRSSRNKRGMNVVALLGAVLLGVAACDLDVANPNAPDRERALAESADVESLIAGAFNVFFEAVHNSSQFVNLMACYGSEMTAVTVNGGCQTQGVEPRIRFGNDVDIAGGSGEIGPRIAWPLFSQVVSNVNDGLQAIESQGLTLTEGGQDVTPRARAFGHFMKGLAWGYMAVLYDEVIVVRAADGIRENATEQAIESITPRAGALAVALESFDAAISIAQQHNVTFPSESSSRLFFATPSLMSNAQFLQLANTMAARVLVLSARTPEERANLQWDRVLAYTSAGLTTDFEVVVSPDFRTSAFITRAQNNATGCADCMRLDVRAIGSSDTSGAWQTWLGSPINDRTRFDIITPDRRITGETPTSPGAYARYHADNNSFPAGVTEYRRSAYQWYRLGHDGITGSSGQIRMASADENNLLRAEALLYSGNQSGAASLINISRTRSHTLPDGQTYPGLPALEEDQSGVYRAPGANCVPRTDEGACGDILTALRHERMIELAGFDTMRGYLDSRGFAILPDQSWLQLPIPALELEVLALPLYSFGGLGGEWSATYGPKTWPLP